MMTKLRLEELKRHGLALQADGHGEGEMIAELTVELDRLRERDWTPERLHAAYDRLMSAWLLTPQGRDKGLGGTTLLELMEWSGQQAKARLPSKGAR